MSQVLRWCWASCRLFFDAELVFEWHLSCLLLTSHLHLRRFLLAATKPLPSQDITDVPASADLLVDRCLLQPTAEGYRLHDLVLEYLQLTKVKSGSPLAGEASSRQARYLARLGVFAGYANRGTNVMTGGMYTLVALWNSVNKLDTTVNVEKCYAKSLEGVPDVEITIAIGLLLFLLVRAIVGCSI